MSHKQNNRNKRDMNASQVLIDSLVRGGIPRKQANLAVNNLGGRNKKSRNKNKKNFGPGERKNYLNKRPKKKMINGVEVLKEINLEDLVKNDGVPSQDFLDDFVKVSSLNTLAQVPNTVIEVPFNTDSLTAAAYQWPGYCMANNVGINDVINIPSVGAVGALYFMAATLAYDLWQATSGEWSIFAKYPAVYADLRSAIMPTTHAGYKYQFVSVENFFGAGGLYPTGYPLVMDTVSLTWKSGAAGSLDPVNTTIPLLTVDSIVNYGPSIVMDYWTKIVEAENSKHKWVAAGSFNPYLSRTEAFAQLLDVSGNINYRWCQYALETPFAAGAKWLAYMGFASSGANGTRAGFNVCANYQTAANYAHRIIDGINGILPYDIIIRHKTIDIESLITSITATAVAADLQYNGVAGTNSIDQPTLERSVLYNVDAGRFFRAALATIIQRFALYNFVGADNSLRDCYVLAGSLWSVSAGSLTNRLPTWVCESLSGLQRLDRLGKFKNGKTSRVKFVTYPLLVSYGLFGVNGYSPESSQNDLLPLLNQMYPGFGSISYKFKTPPVSGLPALCNPLDFTQSQVEGDDMPDAIKVFNQVWSDLQGNASVSVSTNAIHDQTTFMHMTRMLVPSRDFVGDKYDRVKETIVEKDGGKHIVLIPDWSPIYESHVDEIRSRYKFTMERITWIMTRVLPMSFLPKTDYAVVYKEKYASAVNYGGVNRYLTFGTETAFSVSHPIAGTGDEQVIGDQSRIEMGLGGGFFDVVSGVLGKLLS